MRKKGQPHGIADTPEIITDYEVHGAARSDVGKATDVVEQLETADRVPEKLYADGGVSDDCERLRDS